MKLEDGRKGCEYGRQLKKDVDILFNKTRELKKNQEEIKNRPSWYTTSALLLLSNLCTGLILRLVTL